MLQSRKLKVAALSLSQALAKIIGIAVTMVMARVLIKEDLAAYRQTLLAYAAAAPLLSLGIGQGMYYFLPAEKYRIRGRVLDGLVVSGCMGLAFAAFIALGGNELLAKRFSNPKVATMLLWMIPYSILTTPANVASSVFVARDKVALSAVFGVVRQLLIGFATVVPLLIWQTAESSLAGNVAASILMAVAALGLMIRSTPNDSATPTRAGVRELVVLTVPLALASMIGAITLQLDKIIVSVMCAPDEFAVYAIGAMEIPLIGVVTGAITSVALADMRRSIVVGDEQEALRLFRSIAEKSSYVILPTMIFLLITADTCIRYLFTENYAKSAIPFRFYLMLLPIRTVVFGSLIIALGKSRFILLQSAVGLIVNAILSALLVWQYGPSGAAAATIATIYLWTVPANLYVLSRSLDVRWHAIMPFGVIGRIFLAISPLVAASAVISALIENTHMTFVLIALCFSAYLAVYWNNRIYSYSGLRQRFLRERG